MISVMNKTQKSSRKRNERRLKRTHPFGESLRKPKKYNTFVSDPKSGTYPDGYLSKESSK